MLKWLFLTLVAFGLGPASAAAYSMLTHQATVDKCWPDGLLPLLARRYPGATPQEWQEAKANAYGGSIIQDMGYYPLNSKFFTNLTHYVRSGDFVRNLPDEARDRNEYAFALGALAHYTADIKGHAEGTNRALPSVYPKLAARYGPVITYEEAPAQHVQLEFGFDVVMLATGRYRSSDYHNFIGFVVNKPVLERAFLKTYGLTLGQVMSDVDLGVGSFRFAVQRLIPLGSRAAWQMERKNILRDSPLAKRRTLAFRLPTAEAQELFKHSLRDATTRYGQTLAREQQAPVASPPGLPNYNLDTGRATEVGEYGLADATHGEWLRQLAGHDFAGVTPDQKQDLLRFYEGPACPPAANKAAASKDEPSAKTQAETRAALGRLLAFDPAPPH